jgi:DNA topoisomerase IA
VKSEHLFQNNTGHWKVHSVLRSFRPPSQIQGIIYNLWIPDQVRDDNNKIQTHLFRRTSESFRSRTNFGTWKKHDWVVTDIKTSEQKRSPRAPFTTSTLQQTASTRLGFSPSRTMQVAQKLYEEGHITYMRTDSTNLSKQAQAQVLAFVEKKYGKENAEFRTYATKSKNAQEAHEAIRPTHIDNLSAGFTDEQKSLYKLIWERTVSSQMTDAKLMKTKLIANINCCHSGLRSGI